MRATSILEAFTREEFRASRITEVELRKMLGLERIELDVFLKTHGIYLPASHAVPQ